MEQKKEENGLKLNGITLPELVKELHGAYQVYPEDTSEHARYDPNSTRAERINKEAKGLERHVKDALGGSQQATKEQAEKIVREFAMELARAEGHSVKPDEFDDEKVRKYIAETAGATGINSKLDLVESIVNMIAANPDSVQYDRNSALGRLINYIAAQKDRESKRINHLQTVAAEAWTKPEYGIELQKAISDAFGMKLNPTATAQDAFREINSRAQVASQVYASRGPKTYLQSPQSNSPQPKYPVAGAPAPETEKKAA